MHETRAGGKRTHLHRPMHLGVLGEESGEEKDEEKRLGRMGNGIDDE